MNRLLIAIFTTIIASFFVLPCLTSAMMQPSIITVLAGQDLQAALNTSQCGDTISVQAGASWDAANADSPFIFANKNCGPASPIRLQTSALASLPNGRVSPLHAGNMARLRGKGGPAVRFMPGASHWILDGLEITNTGTDAEFVPSLIEAIDTSIHDITIQRSYLHPRETGTDYSRSVRRAIYFNGHDSLFKWNHASGFFGTYSNGTTLIDSGVLLTIKGHHLTLEDNYLESWFASIFTGGGQTQPESTSVISNSTLNSATFSNVSGLAVGAVIRFELHGVGILSGNVLTRTSGDTLDTNDVTAGPGANAVWLNRSGDPNTYRFGLGGVSGNIYTLNPFSGGAPTGTYSWTCFQTAIVTGISGTTVTYTPHGVNQLRHAPSGQASWRTTPVVHDLRIIRNTFNIDVQNAEWAHNILRKPDGELANENPKGWWEFKDATNVLIEGNRFTGYPSVMGMVPRSDEGATPWSTMRRITVRNNLFDLAPEIAGEREWFIASGDDNYNSSTPGGEFSFTNNLVINVNSLGFVRSFRNSTITHNTVINRPNPTYGSKVLQSDVNTNTNLVLKDNVFANNEYGIVCLLPGGFANCWPSMVFQANVIPNNSNGGNLATLYGAGILGPVVTSYAQVGFVDVTNGNYALSASSPFKGKGSDGKDPGVDMVALLAAIGGAAPVPTPTVAPTPQPTPSISPSPTPTPLPSPTPTPTPIPSPSPIAPTVRELVSRPWPRDLAGQDTLTRQLLSEGCQDFFVATYAQGNSTNSQIRCWRIKQP